MPTDKPKIAIFASPKCTKDPKLYKAYFNVAWFVRAYSDVLADYEILTTPETRYADEHAIKGDSGKNADRQPYNADGYWDVPTDPSILQNKKTKANKFGFDGQVWLMGAIVRGEVERVLMFMDPLDTKEYLPETYAFIRNCTIANVGLHINLGATYWAETVREKKTDLQPGFGKWSIDAPRAADRPFRSLLDPENQVVHFIAHNSEKEKLSQFVYHYRQVLSQRAPGWGFSGTVGTCTHIKDYLAKQLAPYWECPRLHAAGGGTTGHGPTGGDVVIADEIRAKWPLEESLQEEQDEETPPVKHEVDVRKEGVSHTVLFFIDYQRARPHETDIHVLLRTCLNPHRGVHLILNERSAVEWGETIRTEFFSKDQAPENAIGKEERA